MAVRSPKAAPLPHPALRDQLDRDLVALLQADARMSVAHLARKLEVARTTVLARLSRLEDEGVIVGYTVRLGADAADPGLQAYVGISINAKQQREVLRQLARMPELEQLASVSGEYDYMAVLRAPTTTRLDALLDEIGETEGVLRTTTSVVLALKIDRRAERAAL